MTPPVPDITVRELHHLASYNLKLLLLIANIYSESLIVDHSILHVYNSSNNVLVIHFKYLPYLIKL